MDLLVGMWAEKNVPNMDAAQLKAMEEVLDQENPDLFKWLTGQESASEDMMANPAFKVRHPAPTFVSVITSAALRQACQGRVRGDQQASVFLPTQRMSSSWGRPTLVWR